MRCNEHMYERCHAINAKGLNAQTEVYYVVGGKASTQARFGDEHGGCGCRPVPVPPAAAARAARMLPGGAPGRRRILHACTCPGLQRSAAQVIRHHF